MTLWVPVLRLAELEIDFSQLVDHLMAFDMSDVMDATGDFDSDDVDDDPIAASVNAPILLFTSANLGFGAGLVTAVQPYDDVPDTGRIVEFDIAAGGVGYAPGDVVEVDAPQQGSGYAFATVDTVDGEGAIVTLHLTDRGRYYVVGAVSFVANSGVGINATGNVTEVSPTGYGVGFAPGDEVSVVDAFLMIVDSVGSIGEVLTLHVSDPGMGIWPEGYNDGAGANPPSAGEGLRIIVTEVDAEQPDGTLQVIVEYSVIDIDAVGTPAIDHPAPEV